MSRLLMEFLVPEKRCTVNKVKTKLFSFLKVQSFHKLVEKLLLI